VISWLLNRIEKAPSTLFLRAELIKQSRTGFNNLKKAGILLYVQPNDRGMRYPCSVSDCGNGCSMDVFKKKGQYYAVCPDDRIDPKSLTDDDIARYRFNFEPLIEKIRKANGLDAGVAAHPGSVGLAGGLLGSYGKQKGASSVRTVTLIIKFDPNEIVSDYRIMETNF